MERNKAASRAETVSYIKDLANELRALSTQVEADTLAYLLDMILYESDSVLESEASPERRARAEAIETQRLYMTDALEDDT